MRPYIGMALALFMLCGCDGKDIPIGDNDSLHRYVSSVRSGMAKYPVAQDFSKLFEDEQILRRITHWCVEGSQHQFQVRTFLHNRYELASGTYVQLSDDCSAVTMVGSPRYIILKEITEVTPMPDDTVHISFGDQWQLTQEQWNRIAKSGGDFKSIGLELETDRPVQNIA